VSHINDDLKVNISETCLTPSLNLMTGTENIFEALIFGPLLLLHMITQEQFNEYVQHKSLKPYCWKDYGYSLALRTSYLSFYLF
jgi:hypothetical protein